VATHVRSGSIATLARYQRDVRFTPIATKSQARRPAEYAPAKTTYEPKAPQLHRQRPRDTATTEALMIPANPKRTLVAQAGQKKSSGTHGALKRSYATPSRTLVC
jgi:hypothetical protein